MDLTPNPITPIVPDVGAGNKPRAPLPSSKLRSSQQGGFCYGLLQLGTPLRRSLSSKIDDVRVNGWLDAMIASSPGKNLDRNLQEEDEINNAYVSWTLKYPSALTSFEQITTYAQGKQIALFLDYDGTLAPIVEDPDHAIMSSAMRTAVGEVAKCFPTAIISGRCRDKVFEFIGLTELYYAGSHGMDIIGPVTNSATLYDHPNCIRSTDREGKEVNLFQPASDFIPMIEEVYKSLVENTKDIPGAKVENNKFCVSVHYRLVEGKNWPVIAQYVHDILKGYPRLRLTHGRKVLEIRPTIEWNKGKAVEFLLESLGLNDREDVLPIYIGDDRTDEDAFKVLRERNRGFGILVSSVPKESVQSDAFYSLREPTEVMDFLKSLVRWKKAETMAA